MEVVRPHRERRAREEEKSCPKEEPWPGDAENDVFCPNHARSVSPQVQRLFDDVNKMHNNLNANDETRQEILRNMIWNLFVEPKQRRDNVKMMKFAILIAGLSFACYTMLREFLILPDYSTVFRHASQDLDTNVQRLTKIDSLKMYRLAVFA